MGVSYHSKVLLVSLTVVFAGSYMSIGTKLMNRQQAPPCQGCEPESFSAPWWQTFCMYLGQGSLFFAYFADQCLVQKTFLPSIGNVRGHFEFTPPNETASKPRSPFWVWIVPALFNMCVRASYNYAFLLTYASTVDLIRNCNVLITSFLSLVIIRRCLRVYEWIGVCVLTIGLTATSINAVLNPDPSAEHRMPALGVALAFLGTSSTAIQFLLEERIFRKFSISPFLAIAYQSVVGLITIGIVLICGEYFGFEKTSITVYQLGANSKLLVAQLSHALSVAFNVGAGVSSSKLVSAVFRTVISTLRSALTWTFELIVGWNTFAWLNFSSMVIVLGGVLAATNVIRFYSWFGWSWWVKPLACCSFLHVAPMIGDDPYLPRSSKDTVSSVAQSEDMSASISSDSSTFSVV